MMPWWSWAILAAVLALAEIQAPGSYLIWIALGAVSTAALDALRGLSMAAQVVTMTIASGVSCIVGYFVYRRVGKRRADEPALNERQASMVGERGVVSADIIHGQGKVRLGDTVWLAEGPDMPTGTAVVVKSMRRVRLRVEPADAGIPRAARPSAGPRPAGS